MTDATKTVDREVYVRMLIPITVKVRYAVLGGLIAATLSAISTFPASTVSVAAAGLPAPWQNQDIGATGLQGGASFSAGTFTVSGSGNAIWTPPDGFQFVYQPLNGNGTITARVANTQNTDYFAKAGVLLYESLAPNAAHVVVDVTPTGNIEFMQRPTAGTQTNWLGSAPGNNPAPVWLRLARRGAIVTGSWSRDNVTWNTLGSVTTGMASTVYVGLMVSSHNPRLLDTSTFDNVSIAGDVLPSPWQHQDIGATGLQGGASYRAGTFTVSGSGNAIWTPPDGFQFVYQPLTGDGMITARVADIQNTDTFAKAGLLLYESLAPTAAHVVIDVTPTGNIEFMQRPANGAQTNWIGSAGHTAPVWLRLVRSGSTTTASWSPDNVSWTTIGSTTTTLASTVYVGLMVSSHNTALLNTSTFDNVTVTTGGGLTGVRTVFLILMENKNWSRVAGNASAPYINQQLLPAASHAEAYFTPPGNHPSLPNYIWLEAGNNLGIVDDGPPSANHRSTPAHLVTLLNNAAISWKSYQEDISGNTCPLQAFQQYVPRHNPMVYFDDVTGTNDPNFPYCVAHVRPYRELAADLAGGTVARYNFITPNLCNDMHDCGIAAGDTWLSTEVPRILRSDAYRNGGAVFVVWDEGDTGDGPIGLIALSPYAKGNGYSNSIPYTHSSMLRTLQIIFGVRPFLGDAANATDLGDLFRKN